MIVDINLKYDIYIYIYCCHQMTRPTEGCERSGCEHPPQVGCRGAPGTENKSQGPAWAWTPALWEVPGLVWAVQRLRQASRHAALTGFPPPSPPSDQTGASLVRTLGGLGEGPRWGLKGLLAPLPDWCCQFSGVASGVSGASLGTPLCDPGAAHKPIWLPGSGPHHDLQRFQPR